jgi:hypothetical protein
MKTVLKVVGGKNDGREIPIAVPKFIIGRGEKAHLRPSSDLVSRHHCLIRVKNGKVYVEDLKSRNGTFVNGEKITERVVVKTGDALRVGRLQLEFVVDLAEAGVKRPAVSGVAEAAARTASSKTSQRKSLEDDITDWLSDDDDDSPSISGDRSYRASETVQVKMDETTSIKNPVEDQDDADEANDEANDETVADTLDISASDGKKSRFGKLPAREQETHESSTHAANDVLKKFFNRR